MGQLKGSQGQEEGQAGEGQGSLGWEGVPAQVAQMTRPVCKVRAHGLVVAALETHLKQCSHVRALNHQYLML